MQQQQGASPAVTDSPPNKRKVRSAKGRVQTDITPRRPFTSKPNKPRPGTTRPRPSTTKGGARDDTLRSNATRRDKDSARDGSSKVSGRKENLVPKKPLLQQVFYF